VTPALIARGRERYAANLPRLREIGRRYGVDPAVLVAIWGKETSFGAVTGDFDLLNSLASLAYEGRRRQLFADEFVATLKMMDRGIPRGTLRGSWAGATGHPQFLPSVYLRLAVDGDGDGRADIWNSPMDGLASIAN
jgi:membrane-bound lytic murein transglycosylase B